MNITLSLGACLKLLKFKIKEFFADKIRIGWLRNKMRGIEQYTWSFQPTFKCNFHCSYCVQKFGTKDIPIQVTQIDPIELDRFVQLNKLDIFVDCLVIQGGEPLLVKNLDSLIAKLIKFKKIMIVSNLSLSVQNFIELKNEVDFELKFIGSFHPESLDLMQFINTAEKLKKAQMLQYCCMVDKGWRQNLFYLKEFMKNDIPLFIYRYVGLKNGRIYPSKARYACNGLRKKAFCKSSMVLISANGKVFNCHTKMYMNKDEICSIDNINNFRDSIFVCHDFGICHPCQIDNIFIVKNNICVL
jgi:sulfatase maturation enzyme AslB (radical SAM superfamily)